MLYDTQHTIVFELKLCLGKNNTICPNSTTDKRIVVIMASKIRDEVCVWMNCQKDFVSACIKDAGVLKGECLGDVQQWPLQRLQL